MKRNSEYIGVDEKYIPENEKYVNDSILGSREESKNKIKKFLKIGLGAWLIWVLIVIAIAIGMFIFIFNLGTGQLPFQEQRMNEINSSLNQMQSQFESSVNKGEQEFNSSVNQSGVGDSITMQEAQNQIDKMQSTMDSMMDQFLNF